MYLEVAQRVGANGANLRSLLANNDMATVAALPDAVAVAREDNALLDVLDQLAVALLVVTLDGANHTELSGNLLEALLVGLLGHTIVHVRPLIVLASGSILLDNNTRRELTTK